MSTIDSILQDPTLLASTAILAFLILLTLTFFRRPSNDTKQSPPKPREMRGYTRAEVAQHNKEGDCWLIIKNRGSDRLKVYDISEYADMHPGGSAIFTHAGGDATEGFHGPQHPPTVFDVVDEYCIGWLED